MRAPKCFLRPLHLHSRARTVSGASLFAHESADAPVQGASLTISTSAVPTSSSPTGTSTMDTGSNWHSLVHMWRVAGATWTHAKGASQPRVVHYLQNNKPASYACLGDQAVFPLKNSVGPFATAVKVSLSCATGCVKFASTKVHSTFTPKGLKYHEQLSRLAS